MPQVTHDVSAHKALTADAKAVQSSDSERFQEENALAEDLLGLGGLSLSGRDAESALRAVAYQVNYLVAAGVDAALYVRTGDGDVKFDYANSPLRPFSGIEPRAARIAATLLSQQASAEESGYQTVRTLR